MAILDVISDTILVGEAIFILLLSPLFNFIIL